MKIFLIVAIFNLFILQVLSSENNCLISKQYYVKGVEYFQQRSFLLSAINLSNAQIFACQAKERNEISYRYSLALKELNEPGLAIQELNKLVKQAPEVERKARLTLAVWGVSMEGLDNLEIKKISNLQLMQNNKLLNPESFEEGEREFVTRWNNVHRKNAWISGIASAIVPGSGQVYNGNYQSAGVSFVLNAILLATSINFFDKDIKAAAITSSLFFSVTYLGNIISAVRSTHMFNATQGGALVEEYQNNILNR